MSSINKILIIILVLFAFSLYHTIFAQESKEKKGKIEQFEKELEKSTDDSSKNRDNDNTISEDEGSSFWGSLIGELIIKPVLFGVFISI